VPAFVIIPHLWQVRKPGEK